jgi:hypothetical protein
MNDENTTLSSAERAEPGAALSADAGQAGRTRRARPRRRRRILLAAGTALLVALAAYAVVTNTQPYTLQASIQVNATPQRVWAVLTDLPGYHRWNPFIISSSGTVRTGATLTNRMHDATGTTTFTPVIQVVEPGRELRWIGRVGPGGIFDGQHTFTIQRLGPGRVLFTQRENFTGVAVPFFEGRLHADTLPQFRAMNAALARVAAGR